MATRRALPSLCLAGMAVGMPHHTAPPPRPQAARWALLAWLAAVACSYGAAVGLRHAHAHVVAFGRR